MSRFRQVQRVLAIVASHFLDRVCLIRLHNNQILYWTNVPFSEPFVLIDLDRLLSRGEEPDKSELYRCQCSIKIDSSRSPNAEDMLVVDLCSSQHPTRCRKQKLPWPLPAFLQEIKQTYTYEEPHQ